MAYSPILKILLVDDSALMRHFVARALEMTGFRIEIQQADNGKVAMEMVYHQQPDLIITDLNMPELSGEELLAALGKDPTLSKTPVIVLTADHETHRAHNVLQDGRVLAYMQKPARPEELRRHLEALCSRAACPEQHV